WAGLGSPQNLVHRVNRDLACACDASRLSVSVGYLPAEAEQLEDGVADLVNAGDEGEVGVLVKRLPDLPQGEFTVEPVQQRGQVGSREAAGLCGACRAGEGGPYIGAL